MRGYGNRSRAGLQSPPIAADGRAADPERAHKSPSGDTVTEHRTSTLSTDTANMKPATPIVRVAGTPLLKKVRAIRPMLAERDNRKRRAAIPAI